mmetsp:Transcript_41537/g.51142  ORF Transcript_41537/g.51142 Transcript_41537/m.51142 type:complete len:322 (+) Transcript_41537:24-989(+)
MGSCLAAPKKKSEKTDIQQKSEIALANESADIIIPPIIQKWFPANNIVGDISQVLKIKKRIGDGVTSQVYSVVYDAQLCALKRVKKEYEQSIYFFSLEVKLLSKLSHPNIIEYKNVYIDNQYLYMILELCNIDLYGIIYERGYLYDEDRARIVVEKLLNALKYIHDQNIAHRDIKPENIVFTDETFLEPKLVDFGDALKVRKDMTYDDMVGTPQYLSPQRLTDHNYFDILQSDIWSLGTILYEMLSQRKCFDDNERKMIFVKILKNQWKWPDRIKGNISKSLADFVSKCITINVHKRLTSTTALQHEWISTNNSYTPQSES